MRKTSFKNSNRLIATILTLAMVFSVIPFNSIQVSAATEEHPNAVTVTVVDDATGTPIEGAKVTYVIYDNDLKDEVMGDNDVPTDANGVAEILDSEPGNIMVSSIIVTHDDYQTYTNTQYNQPITSLQDDFKIEMTCVKIKDVEIEGKKLTYNGKEQDLVSVDAKEGDTVTYKVDGATEPSNIAKGVDADTYDIEVTVEREGMNPLVETVQTVINPAKIEISITGKEGLKYNEKEQPLVNLTGAFLETDIVIWKVDDIDTGSREIPAKLAVGKYDVTLIVDRGTNYEKYEETINDVEIGLGELNIDNLKIKANDREYDGTAKEALVVDNPDGYELVYRLNDGEEGSTNPLITDADEYEVYVTVKKENYADKNYPTFPLKVIITKQPQTFEFNVIQPETDRITSEELTSGKIYDFSGKDTENKVGKGFSYSLEFGEGDEGIATIDEDGQLKVTGGGVITVVTTLLGDNNYAEETKERTINISVGEDLVSFEKESVDYIVGDKNGVEKNVATKTYNGINGDKGTLSYSIVDGDTYGLSINDKGEITIENYTELISKVEEANGTLVVTVRVDKAIDKNWKGHIRYEADFATYYLNISFLPTPTTPYILSSPEGNDGWYTTSATVSPTDGYSIARDEVNVGGNNFKSDVKYQGEEDQGTDTRYVYLKQTETGRITAPIKVNIKIDSIEPSTENMKVEIQKLSIIEKLGVKFGFYNPEVEIKFIVEDEIDANESGLQKITWYYEKDPNAVNSIVQNDNGTLIPGINEGRYEQTLKIQASEVETYRGKISFTATDTAGNTSDRKYDDDNVIVVVDSNPAEVTFEDIKENPDGVREIIEDVHYYNCDANVIFTVDEQNFFEDDFKVQVSKNGGEFTNKDMVWSADENNDQLYYGSFKDALSEDGKYVVKISSIEPHEQKIKVKGEDVDAYISPEIVIDTKAPIVSVEYSVPSRIVGDKSYYGLDKNGQIKAEIQVEETNFYAEDVEVFITKDDENPIPLNSTTDIDWSNDNADIHYGKFVITGDGDYVVTVNYTDRSENYDDSNSSYVSKELTIDTVQPTIDVKYQNATPANVLEDSNENVRKYYAETQTAVVTITEHNFEEKEVEFEITATDVAGNLLTNEALYSKSEWEENPDDKDIHTITITYPGDANYTFDMKYSDLATNKANYNQCTDDNKEDYATDYFTVDKTTADIVKVDYSTSVLETILETISFGFYNAKMTVTITAEDVTSGVHSFNYRYLKAAGVSSVNGEIEMQEIVAKDITYSDKGKTAIATFEIPKLVLTNDNQFNGTVEVMATDRSGKKTEVHKETKRIVVDNIIPTAQVEYNEATNVVGDIFYYNGDITATVTINEANFYANDVQVMVSKDGGAATAVTPTWKDTSVDVHKGTFTLTEDGDYVVTINYTDKSDNTMATYTSKQMIIDTKIEAPTYTVNGVAKTEEGGAYKGNATIGFNFEDQNFDTKTIKLTRTRFDSVEDVTDKFIKVNDQEKGGSGSFTIPSNVDNDGIYLLTIGMTDKAKHTTESQMKFTINRYGSVYEYDDYLASLIKDGGQYITIQKGGKAAITEDLVITEYNADRLLEGSLKILITRDGETIELDYTTTPDTINNQVAIGESGWYQYVYAIKASNFAKDGVYKIALTSAYATSDSDNNESSSVPDNSISTDGEKIVDTMNFTVDTTAPEIRNIVNLEEAIVNAQTLKVKYTIVDVGGLKSIEVILNGETIDTITEFDGDVFNYTGTFTIEESSEKQTVQLRATDLAGNVTDTDSKDFSSNDLYVFNSTVTVSTNFFVRWYANTPLFWGSIAGVIVLAGGICFLIMYRNKKKEE